MERVLELLQQFFQQQIVLIILVVLLVITIIVLYRKNKEVKKLINELEILEVDFNTIKSMPLTFKLNKARAMSKVNEFIKEDIEEYINSYDTTQKAIDRLTTLFASAEDNISLDNINDARHDIAEIEDLASITLKSVETLNDKLDDILLQEVQLRSKVTDLKERFRQIKHSLLQNSNLIEFSEDVINNYTENSENEFTAFEEWMYISEFDKAEVSLEKISTYLNNLDEILLELPQLLPVAKEVIPSKIANVSSLYSEVRNVDLYLDHLDVTQSLSTISKNLSSDLANLRSGDVSKVKTSLDESNQNLDDLSEKLKFELESQKDLVKITQSISQKIKVAKESFLSINNNYNSISEKYDFSDLKLEIAQTENNYQKLIDEYNTLQTTFNKFTPATKMLEELESASDKLNVLFEDVYNLDKKIEDIVADENRARQQLLKLHLIINEVQVKINEYKLPSISNDYKEDVKIAKLHVRNIETLLSDKKLNLKLLNSTLTESIDYVYKLYNNVNNIVGMAIMVENAVVFANRYRSTYPEVDSELSKTELYFRNGEYTQSLTTVLELIEKIHPEDYEQLIRENATNVL
ncbi:MAG TPA: septation ring formation regulator EzrA [Erysipelotrichaceae bacterium]|nr:septation ring formation regulator EzrA [Erysipelotrichaceae bacterium]